jgi:Ca2+-binding EF-hand superfamily protein
MAEKDFEIRRVFNTYDEDRDGRISGAELGNCMKKLDLDVSEDAISTMISSADKNGDGVVDFDEFLALQQTPTSANNYSNGNSSTHHGKTQSKNSSSTTMSLEHGDDDPDDNDTLLKETFSIFDKNHDGFISDIELQSILHRLGIRKGSSLKDCQQMIAGVDCNGDGLVDFEEFKGLMTDLL